MGQYPERVVFLQRFQARQAPDVATPGCRRGQLGSGVPACGRKRKTSSSSTASTRAGGKLRRRKKGRKRPILECAPAVQAAAISMSVKEKPPSGATTPKPGSGQALDNWTREAVLSWRSRDRQGLSSSLAWSLPSKAPSGTPMARYTT